MNTTEKLKIAVLCGGGSSEAEISRRSGAQVYESLLGGRYNPYLVDVSDKGWICGNERVDLNDFSLPSIGKFDFALILIHGKPGENGPMQGYFDMMGVPYSTSSTAVMAITFDKKLCKAALSGVEGINLAKEVIVRRGEEFSAEAIVEELGLPFFIKPTKSGSSFGVTKVKSTEEVDSALEVAFSENDEAMCEEFIEGTEISQGVMVCDGKEIVLPATELVTDNEFFDYEAKYTEGLTHEITPARIADEVAQKVSKSTLAAYKALDSRGVIRIDYIIKGTTPYFIEINGIPGMSAQSIIPQQLREAGYTIREAFEMIIAEKL